MLVSVALKKLNISFFWRTVYIRQKHYADSTSFIYITSLCMCVFAGIAFQRSRI